MTLESLVAEVLSIPAETVQDSTEFRDIATWDSMNHILLITRLEEHFSVQFTGDEIADLKTLGDARQLLRNYGVVL